MATRQDIQKRRDAFVAAGYEQFVVEFGSRKCPAFVIPQEKELALPNFAMQLVADDRTDEDLQDRPEEVMLFGVSDSVHPRLRRYPVLHEMFEYVEGMTCCEAAALEMAALWTDTRAFGLVRDYLEVRVNLFNALPMYAGLHNYPVHKCREFSRSKQHYQTWLDTMR